MRAYLTRTETVAIECLFAAIRRILHSLGLQTDHPSFQTIVARFTARRSKTDTSMLHLPNGGKHRDGLFDDAVLKEACGSGENPSDLVEEDEMPPLVDDPIRGGGGAWRTFVSEESYGQTGTPDLRASAIRYRALRDAELQRLASIVGRATVRQRNPHTRNNPFS